MWSVCVCVCVCSVDYINSNISMYGVGAKQAVFALTLSVTTHCLPLTTHLTAHHSPQAHHSPHSSPLTSQLTAHCSLLTSGCYHYLFSVVVVCCPAGFSYWHAHRAVQSTRVSLFVPFPWLTAVVYVMHRSDSFARDFALDEVS